MLLKYIKSFKHKREKVKGLHNGEVTLSEVSNVLKDSIGYKCKENFTKSLSFLSVNSFSIMVQFTGTPIITIYKNHIFDARNNTTVEATEINVFKYFPRNNLFQQNITYYGFWKRTQDEDSSSDSSSDEDESHHIVGGDEVFVGSSGVRYA